MGYAGKLKRAYWFLELASPDSLLDSASAEDFSIGYPYVFHRPGWYMYVVNQTWLQPTIVSSSPPQPHSMFSLSLTILIPHL